LRPGPGRALSPVGPRAGRWARFATERRPAERAPGRILAGGTPPLRTRPVFTRPPPAKPAGLARTPGARPGAGTPDRGASGNARYRKRPARIDSPALAPPVGLDITVLCTTRTGEIAPAGRGRHLARPAGRHGRGRRRFRPSRTRAARNRHRGSHDRADAGGCVYSRAPWSRPTRARSAVRSDSARLVPLGPRRARNTEGKP